MLRMLTLWLGLCFMGGFALDLQAGGSGLNVIVVVNQNSTNSVQLGNYYCTKRNVPPQNYLRINCANSGSEWQLSDFTNTLLNPLLSMISTNHLTNQIDYVVLSMDIPYRINGGANYYNSTTSALFYGFVNDPAYEVNGQIECELAPGSSSQYAASECIFRQTPPLSTGSNFFLTTMLASSNDLAMAENVVSQGATSDATFPTNSVWLVKSTQAGYNNRYPEYDNTVFSTRLRGNYSVMRANGTALFFNPPMILGAQAGAYGVGIPNQPLCAPGAMVDNLNSFGGKFLDYTSGETTVLSYLYFGASGSYGTVTEPCAYPQKFPDPQNYFYQARGFSLAECYYQSLTNPYQGLVVGEPLAAPFAQPGVGAWSSLVSNSVLAGVTNLSGQFLASDAQHPLQQVDLFLDGVWMQTLTNVLPRTGTTLSVSLNGYATTYAVPANATIKSITSNLVNSLNNALFQQKTKVAAYDHGDRIELKSTAGYSVTGAQIPVSVGSSSSGSLTTFIYAANASPGNFLDSTAQGIQSFDISGSLASSSTLTLTVTKTNNATVTVTITNNGNSTFSGFVQQMVDAINSTVSLQGVDGLYGEDVQAGASGDATLNLQPQSGGYAAAQIKATFTGSAGILVTPPTSTTLTQNTGDLEPREHLYITEGATNLAFSVPFTTTSCADGYHELVAVAYEGSHVRTQTRAVQDIIIRNTGLSATLTPVLIASNSSLQPTVQITVTANTNNISSIQLFSTGGLLASTNNQSSATFTISPAALDVGMHPFYAIVTQSNGHQYRTQTQNIGLIAVGYQGTNLFGVDYNFPLQITSTPPLLTWPATAGRSYTVLSTANLNMPFQPRATVVPTNSVGQWQETSATAAQQFYRISVSQ